MASRVLVSRVIARNLTNGIKNNLNFRSSVNISHVGCVGAINLNNVMKCHYSRVRKPVRKAAKAVVPVEEAWVEVKDEASGQIYWWNQQTNETTELGAPRPTGPTALSPAAPPPAAVPAQQQSGGMLSGIGETVVQGFAFGTGSAIAHNVIRSIFDD